MKKPVNGGEEMDLQFGDIQETALITLAIRASETARPNARIRDQKAKEIIDTLGVDVSKFDPFMSHEGVVARTIMYRDKLKELISKYPDAVCINLGCGFDDKFSQKIMQENGIAAAAEVIEKYVSEGWE